MYLSISFLISYKKNILSILMFLVYLFLPILIYSLKIVTKPFSSTYKFKGNFYWKIGRTNDFLKKDLKRILFDDFPICIYRDDRGILNAVSDICMHRGASLSRGKILNNNCLQCPYHGWEYKSGLIENIPGCPGIKNNFGIPSFLIEERYGDVFLCPTFDTNSKVGIYPEVPIYVPPEAKNKDFTKISGVKQIHRPFSLITENVLDIMHISYVHSFGNSLAPVPFEVKYDKINDYSGKTTFYYTAGPTSMSSLIGGATYVKVENEFHLPDTTVTRVFAGNIIKTIVTNSYPIGKNESILHFDLYRNFLVNPIFDPIFHIQMDITLKEDIRILNGIYDNYIKGFMNTKYDVTQLKYRESWNRNYIDEEKYKLKNNTKNKI